MAALAAIAFAQARPQPQRPVKLPSRGTHGAVAAGSEYATEAGMRLYVQGGTAIDAGIATMLAASVVEFSHFGFGGEAPILIRTKDGKVHSIAGVGTMPKLATAQFFREHGILLHLRNDVTCEERPGDRIGVRDRPVGVGHEQAHSGGTKSRGDLFQH